MLTYQMKFTSIIESIDPKVKQMVVEYFDPHGGDSLRLALGFKYDSTLDDLKHIIIQGTPHEYFHERNEELKAVAEQNIDYAELLTLKGQTLEYTLPTYENEIL